MSIGEEAVNEKERKCTENVIPDYDFLFKEGKRSKNGKTPNVFWRLAKNNKLMLLLSTLVYILQALPTWILPIVSSNLINIVTEAVSSVEGMTTEAWTAFAINVAVLAVAILQNIPTTMLRFMLVSKMLRRTGAGIKSSVVRKLQSLSITYHKDMQSGRIQSKFLKDTEQVDGLLNLLMFAFIPNVIGVLGAIIISIYNNGWVSLFFLLIIPCNVLLRFTFSKKIKKSYREYRIENEEMSAKLTNMLTMTPVTKAHGLEETEINAFSDRLKDVIGAGRKVDRNTGLFGSCTWVVNTFLSAVCLTFCCVMAYYDMISVGEIVLYQTMFTQISGYVSGLVNNMPAIESGMEAFRSVSEIMRATDVENNVGKVGVPKIDGNVKFENLSYAYPNTSQLVIKNFNLDVKAGECIAVVGASGSGKSTLMNLIIGFLKPTDGNLYIDKKPIGDLNLAEYRSNISVVSQSSILFSGSIRDNITYGLKVYTEEDLQRVIDMANVSEFLGDLPNGLDTEVGENGTKLSGGQKQRITIARALIRNPKILILDEATSALDNISEYAVQRAISRSVKDRTTFIVAHRLSTIRDADRIIVMDDGECVETGTYDELINKGGKFYQLKQLSDAANRSAQEILC